MPRFNASEHPQETRYMRLLDANGDQVNTSFEFDTDAGYYKGYVIKNDRVSLQQRQDGTYRERTYVIYGPYMVIDRRTGKVLYKVR